MKIGKRRALVEILLCGSEHGCLAAGHAVSSMDDGIKAANMVREGFYQHGYHVAALELAYRLIESSPTLVREYFGKEQSP